MRPFLAIKCLILLLLISFSDTSFSQQLSLDENISISIKDLSLEDAIDKISELGKVNFSYNPQALPTDIKISITAVNQPIRIILEDLCEQADLTYELVEQQIIVKRSKPEPQTDAMNPQKDKICSGFIKDKETGETLIGAAIYVPELKLGTISNAFGFFSLTIPDKDYEIQVSYVGYSTLTLPVHSEEKSSMEIELVKSEEVLKEVVVRPLDEIMVLNASQMSKIDINTNTLLEMPSMMGEGDVIKSIQALPGIKLHGDGSTWFFVRGGNKDQNMILLDDAPIYNPSHMLGLFSSFTPDAAKNITVYKGDLPASYGGRLSSVVDIRSNDGNLNKFGLSGSIGLISSKLAIQAPIVKQKSSFFLSGRVSQLKWFFKNFNPDIRDFNFYDLNSKINFKINNNNRLYLSFYSGADFYSNVTDSFNSSGIRWRNNALTLRWNHIFNKKLFSNTTIYTSNYDYRLYTSIEDNYYWNSGIDNLTFKYDLSWYLNPKNTLFAGFHFSGNNLDPGNYYVDGKLGTQPIVSKKHAREFDLYAENEQIITDKLNIRYGLRLSIWNNTGESVEYVYDENYALNDSIHYPPGESYNSFINLEPRLSLNYLISNRTSLKLSYARTTQYLHLITNSISPFTTLDVWLPSGPNIPDQKADQIALGVVHMIDKSGLNISAEGYYKKMNNQIDYIDHAEMLLNPYVETQLRYGYAKAYGVEFLLKKDKGKFNGWFGYTFSRVLRKTYEINQNREYPAFYDKPHEITFYLSYDLSKRIRTSLNWYYSSGAAVTMPSSFYIYNGLTLPIYDEKNNERLPDYHRMDLSFLFRLNRNVRKYQHQLGFSIYNLYGRKNPIFINFNKIQEDKENFIIPGNLINPPNLLTTNIFVYNMIPSITYYFQFQ
jgi:hypothetical protein